MKSFPFTPQAGVPQGSVLTPTLYITYTHDIPRTNHDKMHIFAFADDLTVLSTGYIPHIITHTQRYLDVLTDYLDDWRIKLNPLKTSFTLIRATDSKLQNYRLHIKTHNQTRYPTRQPIEPQPHTKILGITFDKKLSYTVYLTDVVRKGKLILFLLPRFRSATTKTKLHLFKALLRPLLAYLPVSLLSCTITSLHQDSGTPKQGLKTLSQSSPIHYYSHRP